MKMRETVKYIGFIKDEANQFIVKELEKYGIEGIVPSHGSILIALFNKKQMTMKEIAEFIRRKQPTVTILIDKLLKYGYVEKRKDAEDSRSFIIQLTDKGEDFRTTFTEISDRLNKKIHRGITDNELEIFDKVLKQIAGNF